MIQTERGNSSKHKTVKPSNYAPRDTQTEALIPRTVETATTLECDAVVVGAGAGGLAACIFLKQTGLRVVCIEPKPFPHTRVGESLDWSTPGLLHALGLPCNLLIDEQIATYKRNIKIMPVGKSAWYAIPAEWFRYKPLEFEVVTLHVDRVELDQRLFEIAQELGVTFVWDRVSTIKTEGERAVACQTASGQGVTATWFIDASGQARLFAKVFRVPKIEYGRPKVCLWTYFKATPYNQGTTFFGDTVADEYLNWVWDIPITPYTTSVGYVLPADRLKEQRGKGKSVVQILHDGLAKYPRFIPLLAEQPDFRVSTCSYRSYVNQKACGPNWLMVGEAASMPDPLTANGVTAAFRHAKEAADFIRDSLERGSLSNRQQYVYNTNVSRMGHAFNHSIETTIYNWPVRWGLSTLVAQKVYTAFSYTINALYSKFKPQGRLSMASFGLLLAGVWLWMEGWALLGRLAFRVRCLWQWQRHLGRDQDNLPGS